MNQTCRMPAVLLFCLLLGTVFSTVFASKLARVSVLDKDHILVFFQDGEVRYRDDARGANAYYSYFHENGRDSVITYGAPLSTSAAAAATNWTITSTDDPNYGGSGKNPTNCYRKSKLNGMAEKEWTGGDFRYEHTMEHSVYLRLPHSLLQGSSYKLDINGTTNATTTFAGFTFDIFESRSEAIHTNLVGYSSSGPAIPVDLYAWMGDGGARDYSSFVGNDVYLYNVATKQSQQLGTVSFWKAAGSSDAGWRDLTGSAVWIADLPGQIEAGTFRCAIEGVGCSGDFTVAGNVYFEPFRVSVLGYFYMRIGQDSTGGIRPVPRRPLYIPGVSPPETRVLITVMQPYHAQWATFSSGDVWDAPNDWAPFVVPGNRANPNAWGGHSDALDWDRHLGHVVNIYDILLPYVLTDGAVNDDDLGIAESGNGIPDIIDEARNEVDFWLRLRDGEQFSHGLTNPTSQSVLYQAGTSPVAAWANALNASMLAWCLELAGKKSLATEYKDSAVVAFNVGSSAADPLLDQVHERGEATIRGRDFKMMAAAYLYNLTGDTRYEDIVNDESTVTDATSEIAKQNSKNQLWGIAAYLTTPQKVNYPTLFNNMKAAIIHQAKQKETNYSTARPSRRATDAETNYFQTAHFVERTMIAHAVTDDASEKGLFLKAMILEADWGLGRNPLNIIQMTTASTNLASRRSVENIYTSGCNDGTPGLHPGHTPYLNTDDWSCGMIMGCPSWLYTKSYPSDFDRWPRAEAYFNTRHVWAHSEFTPRQTMRGKTALYGYLYGIGKPQGSGVTPGQQKDARQPAPNIDARFSSRAIAVRIVDLAGKTLWYGTGRTPPASVLGRNGIYFIRTEHNGIVDLSRRMTVR